jgi:hypothetical protein
MMVNQSAAMAYVRNIRYAAKMTCRQGSANSCDDGMLRSAVYYINLLSHITGPTLFKNVMQVGNTLAATSEEIRFDLLPGSYSFGGLITLLRSTNACSTAQHIHVEPTEVPGQKLRQCYLH